MLRHIPLGRMYNLRDLGGYPVPGGETAWERLLRGDNPEGLTEEDLRWLLDRGITTVVDLRSEAETGRKPDQLASQPGFYYFHCPLLSEGDGMPNLETDVGQGYFRMLDGSDLVAKAMRTVAAAPAGVLFHCTAGRTAPGSWPPCCWGWPVRSGRSFWPTIRYRRPIWPTSSGRSRRGFLISPPLPEPPRRSISPAAWTCWRRSTAPSRAISGPSA